jgi:hypothetical protein
MNGIRITGIEIATKLPPPARTEAEAKETAARFNRQEARRRAEREDAHRRRMAELNAMIAEHQRLKGSLAKSAPAPRLDVQVIYRERNRPRNAEEPPAPGHDPATAPAPRQPQTLVEITAEAYGRRRAGAGAELIPTSGRGGR